MALVKLDSGGGQSRTRVRDEGLRNLLSIKAKHLTTFTRVLNDTRQELLKER